MVNWDWGVWKKKSSPVQEHHLLHLSMTLSKVSISYSFLFTCLMNNFFYYIAVGCGENHTILVMKDGKLFSFGLNDYGQLGHGRSRTRAGQWRIQRQQQHAVSNVIISEPVDGLEAHNITQVACGAQHTLAQNEWGEIFAWGSNSNGQLGLNVEESMIPTPKMVKSLATKQVVQIACGRSHSMALTNGNYIICNK